ncbi:MAG: hypothetical protein ACK5WT_14530 [Betaproteobacteria bacterium]
MHAGPLDDGPPRRAFADSRRLVGANRWYAGPAVTLVPLGPAAADGAAQGRWIAHVVSACAALGWPGPDPRVHLHPGGQLLVFAAPADALRAAAELNEWAWERAAAADAAHAAEGFEPAHPVQDDAREHFRARAAAGRSPPLQRLAEAAAGHGVPLLADDDSVSLGEGLHGRVWPRAALPLALDVPWNALRAVPKLLVAGGRGRAPTARLLAAIAQAAGFVPGLGGAEGAAVGGERLEAGPDGASAVLRHPAVTAAVLHTGTDELRLHGLPSAQADVAVITDADAERPGDDGIHAVEELAALRLAVAHALRRPARQRPGTLVLDGLHHPLLRVAVNLPHAAQVRWALFAREHRAPLLAALRRQGGSTCAVRDGRLLLSLQGTEHDLGAVADMPLARGDEPAGTVENLAAAALAAACMGWPLDEVRAVLARFDGGPVD